MLRLTAFLPTYVSDIPIIRYCAANGKPLNLQIKPTQSLLIRFSINFFYVLLLSATLCGGLWAQASPFSGTVVDEKTGQPLPGAVIRIKAGRAMTVVADENGKFRTSVPAGTTAAISYVGYGTIQVRLQAGGRYRLRPVAGQLGDVVVTATESHSLTAASNIGKHAMEHLQPSSFTDILELLPGGRARDPSLSTPNTIHLREVSISSSDYQTSSLGTAFVVDGARVSTNANMQYLAGAYDNAATSRDFTNAGVDMRSISTDDIESVEVVRGIPSVEYGDLTSGLVNIKRRHGGHDLSARFKADMDTKLFYVAKGMEWQKRRLSLNLSADYLINRADPRNVLETYSRVTISARLQKKRSLPRHELTLNADADYGGSFDRDKVDPDLNYGNVDRFSSSYNRFAANLSFALNAKRGEAVFRSLSAQFSASAQADRTERTRLVQLNSETPAATSRVEGEADAVLISPYTYTATQSVDGKPVSLFAKVYADFALPRFTPAELKLKAGGDWQMDKNYGDGQVFDPLHPLYPGVSARPRRYTEIPASHIAGLYAEISAAIPIGAFKADIQAGLRATSQLHLPADRELHGKWYTDPRLNAGLTLPAINLHGQPLTVRLTGGVGWHTKMPTLDQLYPDKAYLDIVELNYYHPVKEYRRVYLQTYVIDPTNPALRAARNLKWEISLDANWFGNRMTVTYFRENMTSGFRSMAVYAPYHYKSFDTSGINANALTAPPDVASLPYTEVTDLRGYYVTSNGSQTLKRGVELTISTRRMPVVNTRLTVTGAWFRSEYRNSQDIMERPSRVVGGQQVNAVGIYRDDDGYIREMYNTNFTFDTDLPRLGLGLSLSVQCLWLTASQSMPKANVPVRYMDSNGDIHDYTAEDAQDPVLGLLVRTNNASLYERQTVPFSMNLNLKATKKLMGDRVLIALFVNKLWDAHPDYVRNNYRIRRYVTPYFGLEVQFKL